MNLRYRSTRATADTRTVDLATALRRGLAPDGGLYLPERLPPLTIAPFQSAARSPRRLSTTAREVLAPFLTPTLDLDQAAEAIDDALDFPVPLTRLDDDTLILELFHGPTLAFKDVGARMLARLLAATNHSSETLTILTATSGDTGGAVADAFHGVAGTRVVVLYPRGQVSERQERQFATLGGNVHAFSVQGSFDDCQRMVKAALGDEELVSRHQLTSANSISIGRLLPQTTYYVHAFRQLPLDLRDRLVFVVPSGNLGNLTAGLMAALQGLPVRRFVAAVNANRVVPDFLTSGRFEARPSLRTLANAMDIGDPSNLERIRSLLGDEIDQLRRWIASSTHTDAEIREAIEVVYRRHGRVFDPHTAVGWLARQEYRKQDPKAIAVVLSTAHPVKFHEAVEPLVGRELEVPERLAKALDRPLQARPLAPTAGHLATALAELGPAARRDP